LNEKVFEVLVALWVGPATAAAVREEVATSTGRVPPITSFYRALRSAHDEGWLDVIEGSEPESVGRPAQRYELTPRGREAAAREAARVRRLTSVVLGAQGGPGR